MKKCIIKRVTKGRNKGQFRFVLRAVNGQDIAGSHPETYHNLTDLKDTVNHNFKDFVFQYGENNQTEKQFLNENK